MRVLIINSVCGRQSTGRIVSDLKRTIIQNGDECRIAFGEQFSIADPDDYHIGSEFARYCHAAYARAFDAMSFGSAIATRKLVKMIKEYRPDIIHLHNIHGYYINIRVLFNYLKDSGSKIVWTLHDCWPFTGHCAYFDYVGCDKWKTGCERCVQKREYPARLLFDRSKYNYRVKKALFTAVDDMTLVTPSVWLSDLLSESYMKHYQRKVIYNGIDISTFSPRKCFPDIIKAFQDKKIILGVASVWDRRKGMGYFVELASRLNDEYQIVLVGITKAQMKCLPDNIVGLLRTESKEELAELYSAAYVYLNPTLEDNFPTTNIEAIACGTPVIAFKTGGCPEVIQENTGIVVDKGDVESLVRAIQQIRVDRKECARIGRQYSAEAKYQEYISLYNRLLEK